MSVNIHYKKVDIKVDINLAKSNLLTSAFLKSAPTRTRHQKLEPYLFLRVAYTAISASQYTTNTDVCVPMCDKMCPNIRGGAWATPPSYDMYI